MLIHLNLFARPSCPGLVAAADCGAPGRPEDCGARARQRLLPESRAYWRLHPLRSAARGGHAASAEGPAVSRCACWRKAAAPECLSDLGRHCRHRLICCTQGGKRAAMCRWSRTRPQTCGSCTWVRYLLLPQKTPELSSSDSKLRGLWCFADSLDGLRPAPPFNILEPTTSYNGGQPREDGADKGYAFCRL